MSRASDCLSDDELALLVDGHASSGFFARIDAHVESCSSCREIVVGLARDLGPAAGDAQAASDGKRFGRYLLGEVLGTGAMGTVYAARDPYLNRKIAIKVLHARADLAGATARAKILKEARAIARLAHPNVVAIHDVGIETDHVFLAMELIEGQTLKQWLASGRRPVRDALAVCLQAARGLAAAHRAGVIHRDFKPANVLVGNDGRVCVGDFGLARVDDLGPDVAADEAPISLDPARTHTGALVGTPAYMAPEQFRRAPTDERSDQFSFAVVLFEALHGQRPFAGATAGEVRENLLAGRVADGATDRVPRPVRRALRRALSPDPAGRFPDMDALIAALEPRRVRPRPVWLGLGMAAAAAAAALVGLRTGHPAAAQGPSVHSMRRLTFDPGCEEFPSFLPDGKTVVYDAIVDGGYALFRLDVETGERRRLTHAPGWDFGAAVSPDGKKILYKHSGPDGREVRVVGTGGDEVGAPVGLGRHRGMPSWTRDGRALLAGPDDGEVIALEPVAGATPVHLGHAPAGAQIVRLAVLPSGAIALTWENARAVSVGELAADGSVAERERNLHRDELSLTAAPATDGYYYTREAATGSTLVFRAAGGGPATVVPEISPRFGMAVAPRGDRLVWSTCRAVERWGRVGGAGAFQQLSRSDWSEGYLHVLDAGHVLVTSLRSGRFQVWSYDLATNEMRPAAAAGTHDAAAATDGRTMVFLDPDRGPGLWTMSLAGGGPQPLTGSASDVHPVFAFDGKRVVFQRGETGHGTRLYVVAPGGEPRLLTEGNGEQPAASPIDGTVVYIDNLAGSGMRLMRTDLAGASPRPIPGLPAGEWRNPSFAPDGKRLLAVRDKNQVVEITLDGSAAPVVRWTSADSVWTAVYAPGGEGLLVDLFGYSGDLWLAEGRFP